MMTCRCCRFSCFHKLAVRLSVVDLFRVIWVHIAGLELPELGGFSLWVEL